MAWPIVHVKAPRVYNPAFDAAGLDWCQVPMGVHPDDLPATLAQLAKVENLVGLNITIPHKASAFALCSRVGPEALRTGVANTLRREADGTWSGESFDGAGFVEAARHHGMLRPQQPALIVGTGGAGTAIAFALAAAGVKDLILVNREPARAEKLARELREADPQVRVRIGIAHAREAGLAVNATSLGLHASDALPFDPALLQPGTAVFDIIAARDTELMAASQALALPTLGGRPMIEHQVAAQVAFWRGEPHPLQSQP
nr:shikimate dehydrogenase [Ramlibacter agri]